MLTRSAFRALCSCSAGIQRDHPWPRTPLGPLRESPTLLRGGALPQSAAGTVLFEMFAGLYFWWPKMTGQDDQQRIGKIQF